MHNVMCLCELPAPVARKEQIGYGRKILVKVAASAAQLQLHFAAFIERTHLFVPQETTMKMHACGLQNCTYVLTTAFSLSLSPRVIWPGKNRTAS